jgi:hypothetical protein
VRSREQNAGPHTSPPGEVQAARANRYATMILVAFRHGLRAAEPSISSMAFIQRSK